MSIASDRIDGIGSSSNREKVGPLGEPSVHDYLVALRSELSDSIAPKVLDEQLRGLLNMAVTLIDHLIVRSGPNASALAERQARLSEVYGCLNAGGVAKSLERLVATAITNGKDQAAIEQVRKGLDAERIFLKQIDALEKECANAPHKDSGRPFDRAEISAYLSKRYGGVVEVAALGSPIGGFSKDVFILSLAGAAAPAHRIVIRRDLPDGPLESSVREEFTVLCVAHAHGVPVARPLWLENDPTVFGGPTICLGFVEGAPVADARGQIVPAQAVASFRRLARVIGRIHAIDPVATNLLPPSAERAAQPHVLKLLDGFEDQWMRRRATESVVLAAGFAWMRAHLPQARIPVAIVHGDASLRNLMVHEGEPTALLDWETWHFGDPAEDLAYVRDEVESFMPWSEFMTEYRGAGGSEISEERLAYWSIWRELRGTVTSLSMMNAVSRGGADIRTAFGGVYFSRILLEKLAGRLHGLLGK